MHYCRRFCSQEESLSVLSSVGLQKQIILKGISISDRTLWRRQCWTTMTHILWVWQTYSPLSGKQENATTEVKSNPINCPFKYNDRLTTEVESALDSQVPMYTTVPLQTSSPWCITRLVGLRPIHPCAQRAFCSHPFKCLHIQGTAIYSKGPSHIWWCMTVFSVLFMPTDSVWVAVQAGWSCVCVWQRRGGAELGAREEWLCETATDRQMGVCEQG